MSAWMVVVVMRVTTLKASGDRLGGLLAYYAGLAEDRPRPGVARGPVDYYLDPNEPRGRWCGRGCAALGVEGDVAGVDLRAVLEGRHPVTGVPLGRRFGDASARGFDATFSAPKSVSVLWALSPDPWVRAEVLAAHDAAVTAALGWFEQHGAVTRRGRDGVLQVDTRGLSIAVFRQHTSRARDPQLHTHAVIAAKVQDTTGRWLSLDARFLKFQQHAIGAVYDAALRAELSSRLGVAWAERGPGVFDLTCIPDAVREGFSKRTAQVNEKLAELVRRWSHEHDDDTPDARTIAVLERQAAVVSRPGKGDGLDSEALRAAWIADAEDIGCAAIVSPRIKGQHSPFGLIPDEDLIEEALLHASDEKSAWLRADLARHLAAILDARTTPGGGSLVAEIDRLTALAAAQCVALGPEHGDTAQRRSDGRPVTEHVTDRMLTMPAVLHEEGDLASWAVARVAPVEVVEDPQAAAAAAIAGHDDLVLVVGPAGTGKTRATSAAVASLQAAQRQVVGLAPSGKAADVLAHDAGCATDTLAGFLTRHRGRPSAWLAGTTVVLDEAGMAATGDLAQLVRLVERNQWRLAMVGDPQQLPSVARGGVFAHWCDTLPHHTLEQPRRFAEPWEAAASLALRAGRAEAVDAYAVHGRVSSAHPALVATQVARAHNRYVAAGRTVAITTTTTDTARSINLEIQRSRRPRDQGVMLGDGTRAHIGDRISTRRNESGLRTATGHRVRNRQTWTVTAAHVGGALTVDNAERGRVELPAGYVATHVELGWAVTGYGTQGDTVDAGIAVVEPATTRAHAYVAMSRGRDANHAVMLDATGTKDPAEQLVSIITRPVRSESALAVQCRLHRAAGVEPPALDRDPAPEQPGPARPAPDDPPTAEPPLDERIATLRRRLDQLQHRPVERGGVSLGR